MIIKLVSHFSTLQSIGETMKILKNYSCNKCFILFALSLNVAKNHSYLLLPCPYCMCLGSAFWILFLNSFLSCTMSDATFFHMPPYHFLSMPSLAAPFPASPPLPFVNLGFGSLYSVHSQIILNFLSDCPLLGLFPNFV